MYYSTVEGAVTAKRLWGSLSYCTCPSHIWIIVILNKPRKTLLYLTSNKASNAESERSLQFWATNMMTWLDVWIFRIFLEAQSRRSHFVVPGCILLNMTITNTSLLKIRVRDVYFHLHWFSFPCIELVPVPRFFKIVLVQAAISYCSYLSLRNWSVGMSTCRHEIEVFDPNLAEPQA